MPVSVDEVFDRIGADAVESLADLRACAQITRVDEEFTVATRQDSDVPTCTHEDSYVTSQCLNGDLGTRGALAGLVDEGRCSFRCLTQQSIRVEQSDGSGQTSDY